MSLLWELIDGFPEQVVPREAFFHDRNQRAILNFNYAPFAGEWSIRYVNQIVRDYRIDVAGGVSCPRENQAGSLMLGLNQEDRGAVEALFLVHGHPLEAADPLAARAMACVALPLCGLALIDAERVLPDRLGDIRDALSRHGLEGRSLLFRMTGCANGCARPYTAELALVGQTGRATSSSWAAIRKAPAWLSPWPTR